MSLRRRLGEGESVGAASPCWLSPAQTCWSLEGPSKQHWGLDQLAVQTGPFGGNAGLLWEKNWVGGCHLQRAEHFSNSDDLE